MTGPAINLGEANAQLVAIMTAAGFSDEAARRADVRALAEGVRRPGERMTEHPDADPIEEIIARSQSRRARFYTFLEPLRG